MNRRRYLFIFFCSKHVSDFRVGFIQTGFLGSAVRPDENETNDIAFRHNHVCRRRDARVFGYHAVGKNDDDGEAAETTARVIRSLCPSLRPSRRRRGGTKNTLVTGIIYCRPPPPLPPSQCERPSFRFSPTVYSTHRRRTFR